MNELWIGATLNCEYKARSFKRQDTGPVEVDFFGNYRLNLLFVFSHVGENLLFEIHGGASGSLGHRKSFLLKNFSAR
jgi:hypothetical protein